MHISAFNIAVACAVTLTVPERAATAQPLKDSAYFCTTEFQAGLVYDPSIKGWRSGLFKPQRKFILQVKYSGQKEDKAPVVAGDPAMTFYHYYLTLTEPGTDFRDPCFDFRSGVPTIATGEGLYFRCDVSGMNYKFNLRTNRFLGAYLEGYIDGKDNNDDTPFVFGGTCSKLE